MARAGDYTGMHGKGEAKETKWILCKNQYGVYVNHCLIESDVWVTASTTSSQN